MNKQIIILIICLLISCTGNIQVTKKITPTPGNPVPITTSSTPVSLINPSPLSSSPTLQPLTPTPAPLIENPNPTPAPLPFNASGPFIESLSTEQAEQGAYVTINGKNFKDKGFLSFVSGNSFIDIETKSWLNDRIVFTIPGTVSGNSGYDVVVTVNNLKSNAKKFIVVGNTSPSTGGGGGGGGGGGNLPTPAPVNNNNPVPSISTLTPVQASVSGTGFTLTVDGANFTGNSVVKFGETELVTSYLNPNQVTANLTQAELANIGAIQIKVFNPPPGGGDSNTFNFNILDLRPTITSFNPLFSSPTANSLSLTVNGTNFTPASIINFGGNNIVTSYVNDKKLICTVPAGTLNKAASKTVKVIDSSMGTSISSYFGVIGIIKEISLPYGAGVDINPETNIGVVAQGQKGDFVTLIDLNTNQTLGDIPTGQKPIGVAINPKTNMAVTVNVDSNDVTLVDINKKQAVATISLGGTVARGGNVAINSQNNTAFVTVSQDNVIAVLDLNTKKVIRTFPISDAPNNIYDIAFNPQTNKAIISYQMSDSPITLLDITKGTTEMLTSTDNNSWGPMLAFMASTNKALIVPGWNNSGAEYLIYIDIITKQRKDIPLNTAYGREVTVIPQKNLAAVAMYGDNAEDSAVEVVDLNAGNEIALIPLGSANTIEARRIAVNPNTGTAIVTTRDNGPGALIVQLP